MILNYLKNPVLLALLAAFFLCACGIKNADGVSDAKCADVFNVRDFGAKGDGKASDSIPIQKAIDAAAKVRGTVFFPTGNTAAPNLKRIRI